MTCNHSRVHSFTPQVTIALNLTVTVSLQSQWLQQLVLLINVLNADAKHTVSTCCLMLSQHTLFGGVRLAYPETVLRVDL
jgi:hypothetical protein